MSQLIQIRCYGTSAQAAALLEALDAEGLSDKVNAAGGGSVNTIFRSEVDYGTPNRHPEIVIVEATLP